MRDPDFRNPTQVALSEDQEIQTLATDAAHEPFRSCICFRRPHWSSRYSCQRDTFATEFPANSLAVELPLGLHSIPIHASVPAVGICPQGLQTGDSSRTQILPREDLPFALWESAKIYVNHLRRK